MAQYPGGYTVTMIAGHHPVNCLSRMPAAVNSNADRQSTRHHELSRRKRNLRLVNYSVHGVSLVHVLDYLEGDVCPWPDRLNRVVLDFH